MVALDAACAARAISLSPAEKDHNRALLAGILGAPSARADRALPQSASVGLDNF